MGPSSGLGESEGEALAATRCSRRAFKRSAVMLSVDGSFIIYS